MPDPATDRVPDDVAGGQPARAGPLAEPGARAGVLAGRRSAIQGASVALLLTAIWLLVSPVPFSYEERLNPVLGAIALIALALLQFAAVGSRLLAALLAALGLWLIASPFILDEARPETINLIVLGGIVLVLSLIGLTVEEEAERGSRG